jgi:hypothetical protein
VKFARAVTVLAAAACAHSTPAKPVAAPKAVPGGVEVEDAIHGVRYELPPSDDVWQVSREGEARLAGGVEAEISYFPLSKTANGKTCRDHARDRATKDVPTSDAPRDQVSSDDPIPSWSFTLGSAQAPVRNRWAFYSRGADCIVLRVSGSKDDIFADTTFKASSESLRVLSLPPERQREWDLIAGMGFLERREPEAALDRFESLSQREPDLAKAHFGALMAGFELGPKSYARALPHGLLALKSEHELSPEQVRLALRAVGVMQLEERPSGSPARSPGGPVQLCVRAGPQRRRERRARSPETGGAARRGSGEERPQRRRSEIAARTARLRAHGPQVATSSSPALSRDPALPASSPAAPAPPAPRPAPEALAHRN